MILIGACLVVLATLDRKTYDYKKWYRLNPNVVNLTKRVFNNGGSWDGCLEDIPEYTVVYAGYSTDADGLIRPHSIGVVLINPEDGQKTITSFGIRTELYNFILGLIRNNMPLNCLLISEETLNKKKWYFHIDNKAIEWAIETTLEYDTLNFIAKSGTRSGLVDALKLIENYGIF